MKLQRCGGCIERNKLANKAIFAARNGDVRGLLSNTKSIGSSFKRDASKVAHLFSSRFGRKK